ncbi:MAG: class I SAM-dependent methyltransferase [Actinomycetota bacterium]|nr:class I SAM-dependent methyltransferase [Actinomycetota bacterium]
MTTPAATNPHFAENRVVWSDDLSGRYQPPPRPYGEQFELQWKLALERHPQYSNHPGADLDADYINDRIYEWTGIHPDGGGFHDESAGSRVLDHPLDPDLIRNRECIDIGCGMGRWTKTMLALGARSVLSIDASESALRSVSEFNPRVMRADVMDLPTQHPELKGRFDFGCFWGVAMCTHDPRRAFLSAASVVKPGGSLYLMVYAPEGLHGRALTNIQRRVFNRLTTVEERLAFVTHVSERRWHSAYPLTENLKNKLRNLLGRPKGGGPLGVLDMLQPFYNWVIPLEVVEGWVRDGGFTTMQVLNEFETPKAAYHVLATKAAHQ